MKAELSHNRGMSSVLCRKFLTQLLLVPLLYVNNNISLSAALVATEWTIKWLFSRVLGHVLFQVLSLFEPFLTTLPWAGKWSQQNFFLFMFIKLCLGRKGNSTVHTSQRKEVTQQHLKYNQENFVYWGCWRKSMQSLQHVLIFAWNSLSWKSTISSVCLNLIIESISLQPFSHWKSSVGCCSLISVGNQLV